jgi:hypothetical protein
MGNLQDRYKSWSMNHAQDLCRIAYTASHHGRRGPVGAQSTVNALSNNLYHHMVTLENSLF